MLGLALGMVELVVAPLHPEGKPKSENSLSTPEQPLEYAITLTLMLPASQVGNVSSRFAKDDPNSPLELLRADVATVLKAAGRQLGEKSLKTKVGVFTVLRSLVAVLPDSIADHVKTLVPGKAVQQPCANR